MLTDVDAEKHAQQILAYQGALEEIEVYNQCSGKCSGRLLLKTIFSYRLTQTLLPYLREHTPLFSLLLPLWGEPLQ